MGQNIIFTNTSHLPDLEKPVPASREIPSWYADSESYVGGKKIPPSKDSPTSTIKRCMPVFDAMVSGYLIKSPADLFVSIKERPGEGPQPLLEWPSLDLIEFHPTEQAPNHPYANGSNYPKWHNYWAIKTPPGYSTLFIQPFHRESVFTILPGVVDTDTYNNPVNFPFVFHDLNFEGLIPKGTPIAQVIPFKREEWTMEFGKEEELTEQIKISQNIATKWFDKYKTMYRQVKTYK
jgi:hypothetical protein